MEIEKILLLKDLNLVHELINDLTKDENNQNEIYDLLDNKLLENESFIDKTSYMNLVLFLLETLSSRLGFNNVKNHISTKYLIKNIVLWKIGEKKEIDGKIFTLIDVNLSAHYGIDTIRESEDGQIVNYEYFD